MQVKISYTTNLEDIPQQVNNLLLPLIDELYKASKENYNCTNDNISLILQKISYLRDVLVKVDTRAAECFYILEGANKAKKTVEEDKDDHQ